MESTSHIPSYSKATSNQRLQPTDITRFPISPPPEAEIRAKETTWSASPKKHMHRPSLEGSISRKPNQSHPRPLHLNENPLDHDSLPSRKRTRSTPRSIPFADSSNSTNVAVPSPNPKPRKQVKLRAIGPTYSSNLDQNHKPQYSVNTTEHFDAPVSVDNPGRSKGTETEPQNYTPQSQRTPRTQSKSKGRPRRSTTPVRYEPPAEQFTPPRAVVKQPLMPSSTRTLPRKKSLFPLKGRKSLDPKIIRLRPDGSPFPRPALDLLRPVPPPSPTQDPLLLVGDDESFDNIQFSPPSCVDTTTAKDTTIEPRVGHPTIPPLASTSPTFQPMDEDESGWDIGPNIPEQTALMDITFDHAPLEDSTFAPGFDSDDDDVQTDTMILGSAPAPIPSNPPFDPNASTGSHIFHSDDEDVNISMGEAEGEFTGRFKYYTTPIKNDPPSSATKARRDSWGKPISPFPFERSFSGPSQQNDTEEPQDTQSQPPLSPSVGRRKSSTLHLVTLILQPTPEARQEQAEEISLSHSNSQNGLMEEDPLPAVLETIDTVVPPTPAKQSEIAGDAVPRDEPIQELFDSGEDEDSSDEEILSPGVVQVTSSDPRAAARAAAILKQHHNYIVDGSGMRTSRKYSTAFSRRRSVSLDDEDEEEEVSSFSNGASLVPRKGLFAIVQPSSEVSHVSLPRIPTSSAQIVRPEDPNENVQHTRGGLTSNQSPARLSHSVQLKQNYSFSTEYSSRLESSQKSNSDWTKPHWKTLDTCFTDERYAVGATKGLGAQMADVSDIDLEAVVTRFMSSADENANWDRAFLLHRATVLVTRQRAGKGAPPSSVPSASSTRPGPLTLDRSNIDSSASTKIPAPLLGPRYTHLVKDAVTNRSVTSSRKYSKLVAPQDNEDSESDRTGHSEHSENNAPSVSAAMESRNHSRPHASQPSVTKRTLSSLGSFVGRTPSKPPTKKFPSIPALPPPRMQQINRGPVATPAKKPLSPIQPPRALVNLSHTEVVPRMQDPKPKSAKELVQLNHIEPPRSVQRPRTASGMIITPTRMRRDSGCSVKDLIKSFEAAAKKAEAEVKPAMRRIASVGTLRAKPVWRP